MHQQCFNTRCGFSFKMPLHWAFWFLSNSIEAFTLNLYFKFSCKKYLLKYNQSSINKLEKILEESGYVVRYERGSFQSGYCILEHKKVVVLNKFLTPEGRVNTLMEIIPAVEINYDLLTHDSQKIFDDLKPRTQNLQTGLFPNS